MSQNDAAKGGGSYRLDMTYKNRGSYRQDALQIGHLKKGCGISADLEFSGTIKKAAIDRK